MVLVAKPGGRGEPGGAGAGGKDGMRGPTSHDIVDQVRRALATRRVGHLGTLDPFASGLLVVIVGRATRLAPYVAGWAKAYEGVIRLGETTSTDDATGATLAASDGWRSLDRVRVEAAVSRFRGAYEQRPPAYSAVKVEGERAYRRARRGEAVTLPARRVEVGEFALTSFAPPDLGFRATVSAGTYLRGLARDLGEELGCGAHLATLVRTRVGPFRLDDAVAPEAVTPADLRDPAVLVAELPRLELDQAGRAAVIHGRPVSARLGLRGSGLGAGIPSATSPVALFADGQLVAVAEWEGEVLKPRVVVVDE